MDYVKKTHAKTNDLLNPTKPICIEIERLCRVRIVEKVL